MNILILNPPFLPKYSRSSRSPAVTKSGTIYYPLWLSYATGVLERAGHEVLLIDAPAEGTELSQIRNRIDNFKPELAVFDTSTPSIHSDVKVLEEVKSWFGGKLLTVLVGTHPSALGVTYRQGNEIKSTEDRPHIENLNEIPWVSKVYKKHLDINNYFYAHTKSPVISFFAGRGCPNKCFYCVYPQVMFGHKYRHRSAEDIVGELEYILKEFPDVKEVLIDDDNFTVDQEHVLAICDLIVKKKLKVAWTVEARVNLRLDVMLAMKKAGCRLLVAGFESGDQNILNNVDKGATIEQAEQFCLNAKKAGLRVHGCFMVGNKGETRESIEKSLKFALKLNPDTAQFFPLMVYPGTRAYIWAQENSFIRAESYRDWLTEDGLHNCVLTTDNLTAQELVRFCDDARQKFYLRTSYIVKKVADLAANPSEIKRTFKAAKVLAKHLFKGKQEC